MIQMKSDTTKYVVEKLRRVKKIQEKINQIPEQTYAGKMTEYFYFLEKRNENINDLLNELKECGYQVELIRVHQQNVTQKMQFIADCLNELLQLQELQQKAN